MVKLDVIESERPSAVSLDMLRQYAAVSDTSQDHLLSMALSRAFSMVQRSADVALLPGRYCVKADDHRGEVRVYMGGKAVLVRDAQGKTINYRQAGAVVYVPTEGYVEVEFTTTVSDDDYVRLLPVVLKYATAVYDGAASNELNAILREC